MGQTLDKWAGSMVEISAAAVAIPNQQR